MHKLRHLIIGTSRYPLKARTITAFPFQVRHLRLSDSFKTGTVEIAYL
jgi:hypothetical protein